MKAVIWDWNGTLLDDVDECIAIGNKILKRRGLAPIEKNSYLENFVFPTKDYYATLGFDFSKDPFSKLSREFAVYYLVGSLKINLQKGARETLAAIREMGLRQMILSASEKHMLRFQVRHCKVSDYFEATLGADNGLGAGKEDVALRFLRTADLDPREVVFIGDSDHDKQIADIIGCHCILIPNGHMSKVRLAATGAAIADDITEVPLMIERMEGGKNI